jgi:hypothetical protein
MTQIRRSKLTRRKGNLNIIIILSLVFLGSFFTLTTLYNMSQISKHNIEEFKRRKRSTTAIHNEFNPIDHAQHQASVHPPDVSKSNVGAGDSDPSSSYWDIRRRMDARLPFETDQDMERTISYVTSNRKPEFRIKDELLSEIPYDIYNCPEEPPENYPMEWSLLSLLDNWNPNDTTNRPGIYQGLCRFDYKTELHKAERYRESEKPFILRDDPQVLQVAERWSQPGYLSDILGHEKYHTEYSKSNHLMYFNGKVRKRDKNWEPPITNIEMTYDEWIEKATQPLEDMGPDKPHWYFRLNGKATTGSFVFEELPFFKPKKNFYIVNEERTRGINCRFGMNGNIAEAHYDGSRNFVMLFGGERRYILSHPKNCDKLGLYKPPHPSSRHSALDWSNPDLEQFPEFSEAKANEVVLQAGDVLYLPTYWFHFIVSLELNWQCNARSGKSAHYDQHITECGF